VLLAFQLEVKAALCIGKRHQKNAFQGFFLVKFVLQMVISDLSTRVKTPVC